MSTPLRLEFEGAFWHITSLGNEEKPSRVRPSPLLQQLAPTPIGSIFGVNRPRLRCRKPAPTLI
jgi:hypothetical protein